jgi:hypothetical protein
MSTPARPSRSPRMRAYVSGRHSMFQSKRRRSAGKRAARSQRRSTLSTQASRQPRERYSVADCATPTNTSPGTQVSRRMACWLPSSAAVRSVNPSLASLLGRASGRTCGTGSCASDKTPSSAFWASANCSSGRLSAVLWTLNTYDSPASAECGTEDRKEGGSSCGGSRL